MTQEQQQLAKRFIELSNRSESRGIYLFTNFLTLAEQSILDEIKRSIGRYSFFGGYPGAERQVVCFGDERELGYEPIFPICCVEISPKNAKFADKLGHRDFLGSLMSLGFTRERLGDIVIDDNVAYLFCLESSAEYICQNLDSVKHTSLNCRVLDELPEVMKKEPDESEINVASERIDAVIASVFNLSRSASQKLFLQKLVYVNSTECSSASMELKEGDLVSVRHSGRFIYGGVAKTTKKGRLRVVIKKF